MVAFHTGEDPVEISDFRSNVKGGKTVKEKKKRERDYPSNKGEQEEEISNTCFVGVPTTSPFVKCD